MTTITFPTSIARALQGADTVLVLATEKALARGWARQALDVPWRALLEQAAQREEAGRTGKVVSTLNPEGSPERIVLGLLPERVSRHNSPARSEFVAGLTAAAALNGRNTCVLAALDDVGHALATARAVARTLPRFSRASANRGQPAKRKSRVAFLALHEDGHPVRLKPRERYVVERARWAAELVDTPAADLSSADFERAVRKAAKNLAYVKVKSIVGKDLLDQGLGGIHAVGRTALVPPRLLLLTYSPPKARRRIALVGKGVVYDTGGLSLKPPTAMAGMKCDMGGAAAAAAAALALAEGKAKEAVVCAVPLAENAIGPGAYRPDDILTMHSGHTVEINNTDAEGRLLLGDAVSYVCRRYAIDAVLDAATLTGAQSIATGIRHAAVVSNRKGLEELAVRVGRETGDLVFPLPFAPEFFQEEFKSKVADMKNSVANRRNAQTSCAAQFVYSHIDDLDVPWLHVDLAGPAFRDERATGFGVALLAGTVRSLNREALAV